MVISAKGCLFLLFKTLVEPVVEPLNMVFFVEPE